MATAVLGILPVWDIDDARPNQPRWYAMPHAQLLADALGDDATLRDVVDCLSGQCLGSSRGPGHLLPRHQAGQPFWWDGGPVLADFGIAAWGAGSSQARAACHASPTRKSEKLGPANFIAPEMRYDRPEDRGRRADVYSLAKALFVLVLPGRGPYPPDGTHRADSEEFSLWETGGGPSLPALRHVLEAATEFYPRRRLSMADFRDELHAWLSRYPDVQFRRRGDRPSGRFGWEGILGRSERNRRDRDETKSMMSSCISKIAAALSGNADAWVEEQDNDGGDVLGDYGWVPNTKEDGFMPDNGTIWMATTFIEGRRIVLEAILD